MSQTFSRATTAPGAAGPAGPGVVKADGNLHLPTNGRLGEGRDSGPQTARRGAVFLDRDGVLVEDVHFLANPARCRLLPGVGAAVRSLQEHFYIVVVTNQSGIARGLFTEEQLLAVHSRLVTQLAAEGAVVDALYYCPHLLGSTIGKFNVSCDCRKPEPGMLARAQQDWGLDLARSYLVGDRPRDVKAGQAAGVTSILLGDPVGQAPGSNLVATDLPAAASLILGLSGISL